MANTNQKAKIEQVMKIEKAGVAVIRYGLAIVLIWIGILKFTPYEAQGIQPLLANSPFFSWLYPSLGVRGFSRLLGTVEIALGLLICCRSFMPKVSAWGSIGGIVTFTLTLSLLLSTPGIIQEGYSFPFISPMPGQFVLKDIVLLGASILTAGEALVAARSLKPIQ